MSEEEKKRADQQDSGVVSDVRNGDAVSSEEPVVSEIDGTTGEAVSSGDREAPSQEQIEQLEAQLAEARDQAVRAVADAQNARRRAEKDVTNARLYALEKFAQDLLPVIDNLERAMASSEPDRAADDPVMQGVELTSKSFLDVLKRFNVEPVDPESEPFDPQLHQAISMVENPDVEPSTVLNVVQKGYTLNGRLIRPAMVMVSS